MDKISTRRMLRDTGVRLPGDRVWRAGDDFPNDITLPVVAKTPTGGSTIGIYMCETAGDLEKALADCQRWGQEILLEDKIVGEEITVAIFNSHPLPVVSIRPHSSRFFDFEAKYTKGQTDYLVPAPLPEAIVKDAQRQALIAYERLGLWGVARADFIVDEQQKSWFLEINTIPGMTATSLSPMAAAAIGMSFETLVEELLLGARLWLRTDNEAD